MRPACQLGRGKDKSLFYEKLVESLKCYTDPL